MAVNEISLDELIRKRVDVRALLGNTTYNVRNRILEHENGLEAKAKHAVYEAVETAFTVLEAVRDHQNRYLAERYSSEFNTIFASYIGAECGLEKLSGIEATVGEITPKYFAGSKINFSQTYPHPRSAMLTAYTEALEIASGSLRDLTSDYFEWIKTQALDAKDDPRFYGFFRALQKNPVKVGEFTFSDFQSPTHRADSRAMKLTWEDIAGYDDAKATLQGYCKILSHLEFCLQYAPMSKLLPKGILLVGPPGTGKTTLANILADQAGVPFESFGAADFGSSYVNQTAVNLQRIFDKAADPIKKGIYPVSILFIDEIDAIGRVRGEQDVEGAKVVTTLNVNMAGHKAVDGVLVIAATNREDILDTALTRKGRFAKRIEMGYPGQTELTGIYNVHINARNRHSSNGQVFDGINVSRLVALSQGYTGADVDYVVSEAFRNMLLSCIDSRASPVVHTQDLMREIEAYNAMRK